MKTKKRRKRGRREKSLGCEEEEGERKEGRKEERRKRKRKKRCPDDSRV